jgi:hypothetical protein
MTYFLAFITNLDDLLTAHAVLSFNETLVILKLVLMLPGLMSHLVAPLHFRWQARD